MLPNFRVDSFLFLGWFTTVSFVTAYGKVCRIDSSIDFSANPDNIYNCNENQDCCLEGGRPSCCSNKDTDEEVLDQVKLWGGVIGAAVAVGILICCCRRDSGCCEGDEDCKYYVTCGCCCPASSKTRSSKDEVDYERFSPPESPSHGGAISTVCRAGEKKEKEDDDDEEEEKVDGKGGSFPVLGSPGGLILEKDRSEVKQLQEIRAKDLTDQLNAR